MTFLFEIPTDKDWASDDVIIEDTWLELEYEGSFFTNQELMDNPDYRPEGWFNPFTEPDKILDEIRNIKTAKKVKEHIETHYPGIDAEYYARVKVQENKERDIKYCSTTWIMKYNPVTKTYRSTPRYCKHWNDCPICKKRKIQEHKDRLDSLFSKRTITVDTSEEQAIKDSKSASQYLRILRPDNKVTFILDERPESNDERMTYELVEQLAIDMLPNEDRGRYSGKLGGSQVVNSEKPEDVEELKINAWMIRFVTESLIQDIEELKKKVNEEMSEIDSSSEQTVKTLEQIAAEADRALEKICSEYKIEKQFLYKDTLYIELNKVDWDKVLNRYT